jgi:hypothetical protein
MMETVNGLRWAAALAGALIVFTAIVVLGTAVLQHSNVQSVAAYRTLEALATMLAVASAAAIVPRAAASEATLIPWFLFILMPFGALTWQVVAGDFQITTYWECANMFCGGFAAWYAVRVLTARRQPQASAELR